MRGCPRATQHGPTRNSANRDETAFTNADHLDLTRAEARQHNAFRYGIHQCLEQPLARMELQVLLPEIFTRLPHLRIATDDIAFKDTSRRLRRTHPTRHLVTSHKTHVMTSHSREETNKPCA